MKISVRGVWTSWTWIFDTVWIFFISNTTWIDFPHLGFKFKCIINAMSYLFIYIFSYKLQFKWEQYGPDTCGFWHTMPFSHEILRRWFVLSYMKFIYITISESYLFIYLQIIISMTGVRTWWTYNLPLHVLFSHQIHRRLICLIIH